MNQEGGIVEQQLFSLTIKAMPLEIPASLDADTMHAAAQLILCAKHLAMQLEERVIFVQHLRCPVLRHQRHQVCFYLARIGELTTLNWVVSNVLPYLVFALIVVFQSEIRHVLADLGRRLTFLRIFGIIDC